MVSRPSQLGTLDISKAIEDIGQYELPEHGV